MDRRALATLQVAFFVQAASSYRAAVARRLAVVLMSLAVVTPERVAGRAFLERDWSQPTQRRQRKPAASRKTRGRRSDVTSHGGATWLFVPEQPGARLAGASDLGARKECLSRRAGVPPANAWLPTAYAGWLALLWPHAAGSSTFV